VVASFTIRTPPAIGLLASAQLGVPSAVIALGLPLHAINQGQASAIFCAALVSIGSSAAGAAILHKRARGPTVVSPDAAPAGDQLAGGDATHVYSR
jgi:hypothetical protein